MNPALRLHRCALLLFFLLPCFSMAADKPEPRDDNGAFGLGWLDQTQAFASDQANSVANQLDRFFGVPRSDLEAAYSSLRLTQITSWTRFDGAEADIRLRGKLHLPRINERISLIFSEDDGDSSSYYAQNGTADEQKQSTKLNLEFNLSDNSRHRLDFRLGLRSSLKGRASLRYRYEKPLSETFLSRFTQTAYFKDGKGFGSISRVQLEHTINDQALIRWTNDMRFEESFSGSQWSSGLSYNRRQTEDTGISWYARISGESGTGIVTSEDLGVRIRRNVARPWLFIEVEPGYTWRKPAAHIPREGSPFIFLRFEMAIGRLDG